MAPKRGLIVKDVTTQGVYFREDTPVWVHAETVGRVDIEYKNRFFQIPADAVVPVPVPAPSDEDLLTIDPCFLMPESSFEAVYRSKNQFSILRCRAHGRLFLEDWRGGIMEYRRLIHISHPEDDPERIWERVHRMSDDWLNYLKIAR